MIHSKNPSSLWNENRTLYGCRNKLFSNNTKSGHPLACTGTVEVTLNIEDCLSDKMKELQLQLVVVAQKNYFCSFIIRISKGEKILVVFYLITRITESYTLIAKSTGKLTKLLLIHKSLNTTGQVPIVEFLSLRPCIFNQSKAGYIVGTINYNRSRKPQNNVLYANNDCVNNLRSPTRTAVVVVGLFSQLHASFLE